MINGTLLLQIFNFYVAYSILKHIILKPALRILYENDERIKQISHALVDLKNQISHHEEHSKQLWQECARKLIASKPKIDMLCFQNERDQIIKNFENKATSLSKEEKNSIIEILTEKVVQKMTGDISHKATP